MRKKKRDKRKYQIVSASERLAKHKGGGFERTSFDLPEGVQSWRPDKEGTYKIDIIPYPVGKGNPWCKKEGALYYERTYYVHRNIGIEGNTYVCLQKTFGKKCPVCEYRAKLIAEDGDEELIEGLKVKQRQLFNVFDHDDPKKGVQIWEISFYNFGEFLDKKLRNADEDKRERYARFYDPERGYTLRLGASEESMGKTKFLQFTDIELKKRKEPLDEAMLEEAVCLDDLIIETPYKELKDILLQGSREDDDGDEDEDEEESDSEEDDEDGDEEDGDDEGDNEEEEETEYEVGQVVHWIYRGKKMKGKIKKINSKKGVAQVAVKGQERPSVVDLDEFIDPEEEAKKKKRKPKDEDDEDDDEDDGEDADDDEDEAEDDSEEDEDSDEEDDEDWDDPDEDVDDEDDEPKPRKKKKKR